MEKAFIEALQIERSLLRQEIKRVQHQHDLVQQRIHQSEAILAQHRHQQGPRSVRDARNEDSSDEDDTCSLQSSSFSSTLKPLPEHPLLHTAPEESRRAIPNHPHLDAQTLATQNKNMELFIQQGKRAVQTIQSCHCETLQRSAELFQNIRDILDALHLNASSTGPSLEQNSVAEFRKSQIRLQHSFYALSHLSGMLEHRAQTIRKWPLADARRKHVLLRDVRDQRLEQLVDERSMLLTEKRAKHFDVALEIIRQHEAAAVAAAEEGGVGDEPTLLSAASEPFQQPVDGTHRSTSSPPRTASPSCSGTAMMPIHFGKPWVPPGTHVPPPPAPPVLLPRSPSSSNPIQKTRTPENSPPRGGVTGTLSNQSSRTATPCRTAPPPTPQPLHQSAQRGRQQPPPPLMMDREQNPSVAQQVAAREKDRKVAPTSQQQQGVDAPPVLSATARPATMRSKQLSLLHEELHHNVRTHSTGGARSRVLSTSRGRLREVPPSQRTVSPKLKVVNMPGTQPSITPSATPTASPEPCPPAGVKSNNNNNSLALFAVAPRPSQRKQPLLGGGGTPPIARTAGGASGKVAPKPKSAVRRV